MSMAVTVVLAGLLLSCLSGVLAHVALRYPPTGIPLGAFELVNVRGSAVHVQLLSEKTNASVDQRTHKQSTLIVATCSPCRFSRQSPHRGLVWNPTQQGR